MPPDFAPSPNPAPQPSSQPESDSLLSGLLSFIRAIFSWAILPIAIVLFLHTCVFQAFRVVGNSMVPTLQEADYLIISKVDATLQRARFSGAKDGHYIPKRGEVVVFKYPQNQELVFVKRVIAIPGERVTINDGKVLVYNQASPKGFNPDKNLGLGDTYTMGEVDETVPEGSVFVLGDNRSLNGSFDSREWGFLGSQYILGKTVMRLLPVDKLRFFSQLPASPLHPLLSNPLFSL